jgi:hypothetical protein
MKSSSNLLFTPVLLEAYITRPGKSPVDQLTAYLVICRLVQSVPIMVTVKVEEIRRLKNKEARKANKKKRRANNKSWQLPKPFFRNLDAPMPAHVVEVDVKHMDRKDVEKVRASVAAAGTVEKILGLLSEDVVGIKDLWDMLETLEKKQQYIRWDGM